MTQWIIEGSVDFTDMGLLKISESIRAYAYLILSSQAYARPSIIGYLASAVSAQSAFLNNFENVVNRKVDISEDIKRYQNTLSYASSKVDYSVGEHLYMLPSDMTLKIRPGTVGYNNKILVSGGNFSLGKNDEVNETPKISHQSTFTHGVMQRARALWAHHELEKKPNITQAQKPTITHHELAKEPTHEDKKLCWYWLWQVVSQCGIFSMKHENGNCSFQNRAEPIITQK